MPETDATAPAFRYFWLKDRNPVSGRTKRRLIGAPNEPMEILHAALIRRLRNLAIDRAAITGSLPGCNPVRNVLRHRQSQFFYLLDLSNAYGNVDGERLITLLTGLMPDADPLELGSFLRQYCLAQNGGLIVGAPASPDLFNIYAALLIDAPLAPLCERYRLRYTRYLDDLTFSSGSRIGCKKRRAIRDCIASSGLPIQHRKCEVVDVTKRSIVITGVGLDAGGFVFLPRRYLRKVRGLLHRAMYKGDVSRHTVEGAMGVFKSMTRGRRLTASEQHVLIQYHRYRRWLAVG